MAPDVEVQGNTVVAGLRQTSLGGAALVTVLLARDVRWQVRLGGGAGDQAVDLTGGSAGGDVEFTAGTSRAEVELPAATGTQKVVLAGGASLLTVHLGGDAPVRVSARNGAGAVTVDGTSHAGVAGGSVFADSEWDSAGDRFDVDATSGVSGITVERG
ncbi:hypothetical protein [Symbioplanes lichenis]|uniref:hypothetical protein n=1 Tax=Symbioplanes lichenis TaxID=1629072 RepID=UPI0027386DF8|nr:hypothetical protein [Actinoplanes lichenis]